MVEVVDDNRTIDLLWGVVDGMLPNLRLGKRSLTVVIRDVKLAVRIIICKNVCQAITVKVALKNIFGILHGSACHITPCSVGEREDSCCNACIPEQLVAILKKDKQVGKTVAIVILGENLLGCRRKCQH